MATENAIDNSKTGDSLPFELNPESVSAWLDRLPADDRMEACKQVYSSLQTFNRLDSDADVRFRILEVFRPMVFMQSSYLESYILVSEFPLQRNLRKIAKLTTKLQFELAAGYRTVATTEDFSARFSTLEQATVCHRAMQSISISLLRIAQMYEPPSSGFWKSLKSVYLRAAQNQLLGIDVADELDSVQPRSTIADIVVKTALFSVSNPCRYTQSEMKLLFRLFAQTATTTQLQVSDRNALPQLPVSINSGDSLPPLIGINRFDASRRDTLCFDLTPVIGAIPETVESWSPTCDQLRPATLNRLLYHLGAADKPNLSTVMSNTEVILGLPNALSRFNVDRKTRPADVAAPGSSEWLQSPDYELVPLDNDRIPQSSAPRAPGNSATRANSTGAGEIWKKRSQTGADSSRMDCDVMLSDLPNHILVELSNDQLKIGEILAIRDSRIPLELGITRWKQTSADTSYVYYGVEKLADKCSLADVFIDTRKFGNTLLLQTTRNRQPRYSILLPPKKFRSGTRITVKQAVKTTNFKLEKLLESSTEFCHYSLNTCKPLIPGS